MKIAIMQPYFLPYIGYFQLINFVDKFIAYDDVNFIKRGWINRNYILLDGKKHLFTIPCKEASQNKTINQVQIDWDNRLIPKFMKTIHRCYSRAPYYSAVEELIYNMFEEKVETISELAIRSLKLVCSYINIKTQIVASSQAHPHNQHLRKEDRLIDICKQEGADTYVNPIGGLNLYKEEDFLSHGIKLWFIKPESKPYRQLSDQFIPSLSIIDVLMFNSPEEMEPLINSFTIITNKEQYTNP